MLPRWFNLRSRTPALLASRPATQMPFISAMSSYLSRDELRVLVQPHQLVLTRLSGWGKRRVVREEIIAIPQPALAAQASAPKASAKHDADNPQKAGETASASRPAPWHAALQTLAKALQHSQWQGCQPRVVLSNHLVRYGVIPWNASLGGQEEQHAFVRHCFSQAYGEAARLWDIRLSPAGYGKPSLASGVEPDLLQALQLCFAEAGMRLQHIHPLLMQAINETRRQLVKQRGKQRVKEMGRKNGTPGLCLAVLEQGRVAVLLQQDHAWRSVQCHATTADALPALIQRDAIIAGLDSQHWPLVVYAAEPGTARLHIAGRQFQQLGREIPFVRQPDLAKARP